MNEHQKRFKKRITLSIVTVLAFIVVFGVIAIPGLFAQQTTAENTPAAVNNYAPFALIGAAIAFGFGAMGAGIAIASVGAAAMGAIGEKPEIAGNAIIFVALAEGVVVFGFITALMILGKM